MRRKITFAFMGAYWSLPVLQFEAMMILIDNHGHVPDPHTMVGIRVLKSRPKRLDWLRIEPRRR